MADRRLVAALIGLVTALGAIAGGAAPASAQPPGSPLWVYFPNGDDLCIEPSGGSRDAGTAVVLAPCDWNSEAQAWVRDYLGGGVLRYRNVHSDLCLDAFGSAATGTKVVQWPCNSISNERWQPVDLHDGPDDLDKKIVSRVSGTSSFCLDVPFYQQVVGLQVQIARCNGTGAQIWYEIA